MRRTRSGRGRSEGMSKRWRPGGGERGTAILSKRPPGRIPFLIDRRNRKCRGGGSAGRAGGRTRDVPSLGQPPRQKFQALDNFRGRLSKAWNFSGAAPRRCAAGKLRATPAVAGRVEAGARSPPGFFVGELAGGTAEAFQGTDPWRGDQDLPEPWRQSSLVLESEESRTRTTTRTRRTNIPTDH